MRIFIAALAALICAATSARAQDAAFTTTDPAVYAQAFSDAMTLSGVRPIRETFTRMLAGGGTLTADLEAALQPYEAANLQTPARIARVIDDVMLSDVLRTVYLYHYFGGNGWIFTRLEFVRISETEWSLSRLAFSDRWAAVALSTTPGFRPSPGVQH